MWTIDARETNRCFPTSDNRVNTNIVPLVSTIQVWIGQAISFKSHGSWGKLHSWTQLWEVVVWTRSALFKPKVPTSNLDRMYLNDISTNNKPLSQHGFRTSGVRQCLAHGKKAGDYVRQRPTMPCANFTFQAPSWSRPSNPDQGYILLIHILGRQACMYIYIYVYTYIYIYICMFHTYIHRYM